MQESMSRWRSIICVMMFLGASCTAPFTPRDEQDRRDAGAPTADGYAFCEWRDFERSDEVAADLVGEWIAFWYEIDYGHHTQLTLNEDGTYRELRFPSNGCEAEERCFGSGPDDLCSATETLGSWTFEGGALRLSELGYDLALIEGDGPDDILRFGYGELELILRAASCPSGSCPSP